MESESILRFVRFPHRIIIVLSLMFLTSFCDKESKPGNHSKGELENLTLTSLEKVNDYPLYVMTYYGDYGFDEYLKTGRRIDYGTFVELYRIKNEEINFSHRCNCLHAGRPLRPGT